MQVHAERIPKSAKTPGELLTMCGISAKEIVKKAMELLQVA